MTPGVCVSDVTTEECLLSDQIGSWQGDHLQQELPHRLRCCHRLGTRQV